VLRPLIFASLGLTLVACGSKSGLLSSEAPGSGGSAAGGGSGGTGFGGSSAGGAGFGGSGAGGAGFGGSGTGGEAGAPPLPDCTYVEHGSPIVLFTYGEGVNTPTMVPLSSGSTGPARIAFSLIHEHFWHPELRVAEVEVTDAWPDGVSVKHPMLLYGIDAHAPGQMVNSTRSASELALLYFHADEASPNVTPGVKFRLFDTPSWKPADEVFVEKLAGYAYSIAPGALAGVGGHGYGVAWRSPTSGADSLVTARVAILDDVGGIVEGPVDVAPAMTYPGVGATVAWTGLGYLVAHNAPPCPGCPTQLHVARMETTPGDSFGLNPSATLEPVPGRRARTPLLRSQAGQSWVAWREQPVESAPGSDPTSRVRLGRLDASGALASAVWEVEAHPDAGAELRVSDQGVLLAWGERVDPSLEPHVVGHSKLHLEQFGKDGSPLQTIDFPTTSLTTGTAYSVVTLDSPRRLLVAYSAQPESPGQQPVAYLARFDCVEPE